MNPSDWDGRPLMVDLFCGAGGVAMGYHRAGFRVIGIDQEPQPHYPFEFHQMDWREGLDRFGSIADAVHASPPCQGYSRMRHLPWLKDKKYPLLIDPVRMEIQRLPVAWVIENVEDAPLQNGVTLCGTMFGLKVYRHRKFESNCLLLAPAHRRHETVIGHGRFLNDRAQPNEDGWVSLPSKAGGMKRWQDSGAVAVGHGTWRVDAGREALGIDWMTKKELSQAIPPAYTEYVGRQIIPSLTDTAQEEIA